jgi:hypothetical protein
MNRFARLCSVSAGRHLFACIHLRLRVCAHVSVSVCVHLGICMEVYDCYVCVCVILLVSVSVYMSLYIYSSYVCLTYTLSPVSIILLIPHHTMPW